MPTKVVNIQGEFYSAGGSETYLTSLISAQMELGYETKTIYADNTKNDVDIFCPKSHGLRTGKKALECFKTALKKYNPDIIHFHVVSYVISPVVIDWIVDNYPCVITIHDTLLLCLKPVNSLKLSDNARVIGEAQPCLYPMGVDCINIQCMRSAYRQRKHYVLFDAIERIYKRRSTRNINKFIVNSEFSRQDLIRNGYPDSNIVVLRPDLNIPATWLNRSRQSSSVFRILYIGQLAAIKGIYQFLDMLSGIKDKQWEAIIVGVANDPSDKAAHDEAVRKGIRDRIEFAGRINRNELGNIIKSSNILVFPSMAPESLGLVGLEAMYMGLPVVAYDVGAVGEWLNHEVNGMLVKPGDHIGLANAVCKIMESNELENKLSENARITGQEWGRLSWNVEDIESIYNNTISEWHENRR